MTDEIYGNGSQVVRPSEGVLGSVLITQPIANVLAIFTRHRKLSLESPLLLFSTTEIPFSGLGKRGARGDFVEVELTRLF
jgi:hypothetical protein